MPFSFNPYNMLVSVANALSKAVKKSSVSFAVEDSDSVISSSKNYYCDADKVEYKAINIYAALDQAAAAGRGEVVLWEATGFDFACYSEKLFRGCVDKLDIEIAAGLCNMTAVPANLTTLKTKDTPGFAGSARLETDVFCGYATVLAAVNGSVDPVLASCLTTALSISMKPWNDSVAETDCNGWLFLGIMLGTMGVAGSAALLYCVWKNNSQTRTESAPLESSAGFFSSTTGRAPLLTDQDRFEDVTDVLIDEAHPAAIRPLEIGEDDATVGMAA